MGGPDADNDTIFDNSFVVRRAMPPPEGERDAEMGRRRGTEGGGGGRRTIKRTEEEEEEENDEGGDDRDAASLAELTTAPYHRDAPGIARHPHHHAGGGPRTSTSSSSHRRGDRSSDDDRRRGGRGGTARRVARDEDDLDGFDYEGHDDDGLDDSGRVDGGGGGGGGGSRRRRGSRRSADREEECRGGDEEEEGGEEEDRRRLRHRVGHHHRGSGGGGGDRRRHHQYHHRGGRGGDEYESSSRTSPLEYVLSSSSRVLGRLVDGGTAKTVLLCMLGMTLILRLNPPPPRSHPDPPPSLPPLVEDAIGARGAVVDIPGVRGAAVAGASPSSSSSSMMSSFKRTRSEEETKEGGDGGGGGFLSRMNAPPPPPPAAYLDGTVTQSADVRSPMSLPSLGQQQQQQQQEQQTMVAQLQPSLPQVVSYRDATSQLQYYDLAQSQSQAQQQQQQQQQAPPTGYVINNNAGAGFQQPQPWPVAVPNNGYQVLPEQQQQQQQQQQQSPQYAVGLASSTYDPSPPLLQSSETLPQDQAEQWAQIVTGQQQQLPPPPPPEQPSAAAVAGVVPAAWTATTGADAVALSVGDPPLPRETYVPGVGDAAGAVATASSSSSSSSSSSPSEVLAKLNNFKDTWDPYETTDIPMFWHIPKAGGSSIKDAMGGCHRFVQATEFGVTDGHLSDTVVAIVYPAVPGVADTDRSPFVNIDSTTVEGIRRARDMGFADAQLADVVVSPFVFEPNELFTPTARGRMFSVFRHPIERAVSMFYYIRVADWEPSYKPELKDWTLEQYAVSDVVENNWMTRQLSNQLGGDLTEENLKSAMEVVRSKMLVGLMSKIEPSMTRFEKFFRWTYHVNPANQEICRERLMGGGSNSNKANKKPLAEGDEAWALLAAQNNFDLQLYDYIEKLFEEQEAFVTGLPDDFRNVDATCCKCDPPTYPPEGFTCPQAVKNVK